MAPETEKTPKASKSFLTIGPTLHYSHRNVQRSWLLAAALFAITCLLWSRIVTGSFWTFDFQAQAAPDFWRLGEATTAGASIFEYPWQIVVLGLLMGIMAVVPVLIAQLMSFGHSFIFLLAVFFLANLPGFATFLLVSCFAVAARPLRFRSRIIAIALCMAPQLLYWGLFGAAKGVEPLAWGMSLAPWVFAWLVGLTVAGIVLAVGHYTRYKPGLMWIFTATTLLLAVGVFVWAVGFDELDYQFHVAGNDPEDVTQFREHSIREGLDSMVNLAVALDAPDKVKQIDLSTKFMATERIPLREEMKGAILIELNNRDEWPIWFAEAVRDEWKYKEKREWLSRQYDRFMRPSKPWWMPQWVQSRILQRRSTSKRVPIALYYKAVLNEYSPDLRQLKQNDLLTFYWDYPRDRALPIWNRLYTTETHNRSAESIEARWRLARHIAGQEWLKESRLIGELDYANSILLEASEMLEQELAGAEETRPSPPDSLFAAFRRPARTVLTVVKLRDLQRRVRELNTLIGEENRKGAEGAVRRLAKFVMLNPHGLEYEQQLDALLAETGQNDGLQDNLLLEKAKLIADEQGRGRRLEALHRQFQNTDGGTQALYELTRLKIELYKREPRKENLLPARDMLMSFLSLYPKSFYADQVRKNLEDLRAPE
ncbi:MAG: hypothetical protein JW955_25180 [Sedimentisphaerales bacterium]|nr:hypothetical protein [Sedimentisphaerales bacterium]